LAKRKKKKRVVAVSAAGVGHLVAMSSELHRLATLPALKALSPKRHDKFERQVRKVDRAIAKIKKIVS
jgi:hypothetical protein